MVTPPFLPKIPPDFIVACTRLGITADTLNAVIFGAHAATQYVREAQSEIAQTKIYRKSDNSAVTHVDQHSEELITSSIMKVAPSAVVVGEETVSPDLYQNIMTCVHSQGSYWLIDPLDGTANYINKGKEYAIAIAYMHHQKNGDTPVFGLIIQPAQGIWLMGAMGGGVWQYRDHIHNQPPDGHGSSAVVPRHQSADGNAGDHGNAGDGDGGMDALWQQVSMTSSSTETPTNAINASRPWRVIHGYRSKNYRQIESLWRNPKTLWTSQKRASAQKFCHIATKSADIYPCWGETMAWDIAAGDAIIHELGGAIVDARITPLTYKTPWQTNPNFIAVGHRAWLQYIDTTSLDYRP